MGVARTEWSNAEEDLNVCLSYLENDAADRTITDITLPVRQGKDLSIYKLQNFVDARCGLAEQTPVLIYLKI